jgi:hypothetical protein
LKHCRRTSKRVAAFADAAVQQLEGVPQVAKTWKGDGPSLKDEAAKPPSLP